jgi:site-specific recombinase XerD
MAPKIRLIADRAKEIVELAGAADSTVKKANRFLESLKIRGLAFYTLRAYGYDLVILLRWLETERLSFRSLNQMKLLGWIGAQRKANAQPATINRRLQTCHLFYRFCFNRILKTHSGLVSQAAARYQPQFNSLGLKFIRRPRESMLKVRAPRKVIEVLDPDEIRKFLEDFSRYRDLATVTLMLMCGLRGCEVLALQLDDVDFYQRSIRVRGKGGKLRVLPLVEFVADLLRRYIHYERPREQGSDLFLVLQGARRGRHMTPAGLRKLFRYRRSKTGIAKANPHRFRHCFGTEMARQSVPLPVLQKMLGHADTRMTLRYIQLSMVDVAREYERAIKEIESRYANF